MAVPIVDLIEVKVAGSDALDLLSKARRIGVEFFGHQDVVVDPFEATASTVQAMSGDNVVVSWSAMVTVRAERTS